MSTKDLPTEPVNNLPSYGQQLEAILIDLLKYGSPRLGYYRGWHCKIAMNTNAEGTDFDVASSFKHTTPMSAVLECKERAEKAVKTIKETK